MTFWAEICMWLYFNVLQIKFKSCHFVSIFWRSYASFWTKNMGNLQFSAFFSYLLRNIELKFCIWFYFYVLQIQIQSCFFALISDGVMPRFELRLQEIRSFIQFSALFSYMFWHIELKFCICFCFNFLQIKLECRHSASARLSVRLFSTLFPYMLWQIERLSFVNCFALSKVIIKK